MIEKTLRSLCESRYRGLIVIAGTFIVGLVLVLPLVDLYSAERAEKAVLLAELASARQVAAGIEPIRIPGRGKDNRTGEVRGSDGERGVDARASHHADGHGARDGLQPAAIERRDADVAALAAGRRSDRGVPGRGNATPTDETSEFTLESWPVNISLSGSDADLRNMLDRMEAGGMLMHTKNFEMHPANAGGKMLDVDMELLYFNLARNK